MKETTFEENNKRIRFAPKEFYDQCDDCEVLPEERWDAYRRNLQEENRLILQDREQVVFFIPLTDFDTAFYCLDRTSS